MQGQHRRGEDVRLAGQDVEFCYSHHRRDGSGAAIADQLSKDAIDSRFSVGLRITQLPPPGRLVDP